MADNATISINSYLDNVKDTSSTRKPKSYMAPITKFADIFDNANKVYKNQTSTTPSHTNNSKNTRSDEAKDSVSQKNQMKNTETQDAQNNDKVLAKDRQSQNIQEKDSNNNENSNENNTNTDNNTDNKNTQKDTKNTEDKNVEYTNESEETAPMKTVEKNDTEKADASYQQAKDLLTSEVQNSANNQNQTAKTTNANQETTTTTPLDNTISAIEDTFKGMLAKLVGNDETQADNNKQSENVKADDTNAQTDANQSTAQTVMDTVIQQNTNIIANAVSSGISVSNNNLNQLAQSTNTEVPAVNNQLNNIQTQTQQTLSNLQTSQQTDAAQKAQVTQEQIQNNVPVDANAQIPVTENSQTKELMVSSDVDSSQVDTNTKDNVKELLNKTSLNQDILDKTNAKVVSVETSTFSNSNANSNNLLNKQNTQEQAVKLELQSNTEQPAAKINQEPTQNNLDLTAMATSTTQTSFAKTLDATQAQTQTNTAPKELSQNDILAQINKQINTKNLQDESSTRVNIILKPENLGKISLELVNSKDGLTAQLTTENSQVKEILDKSLNSLKDTLNNNGVNVNNVSVKVEETQKQSGGDMSSLNNGQTNDMNQGFSNNTQHQNQNQTNFGNDKDMTNNEDLDINNSESIETSEEQEEYVSNVSHSGQIDYKI